MIRTDRNAAVWVLLAATLAVGACELGLNPTSVTEARNQLRRGGERTTSLVVPLTIDTFSVTDVLDSNSTSTTPGGLVGVTFDADSVAVDVGNQLQFNNVQMDSVKISFPAAALTGPAGTQVPFTVSQNGLQSEARLQAVDTIVAQSGSIAITLANKLPHGAAFTVTLQGFLTAGGAQLSQAGTVNARTQNDGTYNTATLNFNLANVRIVPDSNMVISGTITLTGTVADPATLTDALVLSGTGNIVVQSLAGSLNPATTPELSVTTENADEFTRAQIDFGDFEDAVRLSHLNSATVNITVVNSAQVPLSLTNFRVGAVRCTPNVNPCQPVRVSGQLDFEKDGAGNPILISVQDPGQTTLSIARGQTKTVTFDGALLLDTLVHKLLGNTRMALAATGGTTIGDGAASRISRTDVIMVKFGLSIGLDLTLPLAGVTFKRKQVVGGADLSDANANDLTTRLLQATLSAAVSNGTPFGVGLQISFVPDSSALTVDGLLALPPCPLGQIPTPTCRVSLLSINVPGGTVNTSGLVTAPAAGNVAVSLSGNQARVLLGRKFTIALLIQLVPGTGGAGRGALRPSDRLIVNARAQLDVRSGGS